MSLSLRDVLAQGFVVEVWQDSDEARFCCSLTLGDSTEAVVGHGSSPNRAIANARRQWGYANPGLTAEKRRHSPSPEDGPES